MMRSALGDASKIADYDTLKKRLLGSRYTMNFNSGVNFDLAVVTSDSLTAATLSSLVKAGMLYKKMNATRQRSWPWTIPAWILTEPICKSISSPMISSSKH